MYSDQQKLEKFFCSHTDCPHYNSPQLCNEEMCYQHHKDAHMELSESFKCRGFVLRVARDGRGRFLAVKKGG